MKMKEYNKHTKNKFLKTHSILTPTIWLIAILYTLHSHFNGCPHIVILGGWLVGPPFWLWLEFRFFFDNTLIDLKLFKYKQSLQRNLWLGITTFLTLKYFSIIQ